MPYANLQTDSRRMYRRLGLSQATLACMLLGSFLVCSSLAQSQQIHGSAQESPIRPATAAEVDRLIEQLGDVNFHVRNDAQWQLQNMGLSAFEKLRIAANSHENIQIANSAKYIIESQNIVWWLDTDSVEVRSYLANYSDAQISRRESSISLLGRLDSADAWMALCRLARYERHERLSRMAALTLLETLVEHPEISREIGNSIHVAIGAGNRTAVQWLRMFADNVETSTSDPDAWSELGVRSLDGKEDPLWVREQRLRFFKWLGTWLSRTGDQESALVGIRRHLLGLVKEDPSSLRELAVWAIDEGMPDLVADLAVKNRELFERDAELGYLLAESYLKTSRIELAQRRAEAASRSAGPSDEATELTKNYKITGLLAHNRLQLARILESRGLFDWAENEYKLALNDESTRYDELIRESLSLFYWFGGDFSQAAETLKPLVDEIEAEIERFGKNKLQSPFRNSTDVLSVYYYYRGLAETEAQETQAAQASLRKAYGYSSLNPDVVIAMKDVATTSEYQEFYRACFEQMRDTFRHEVISAEERLARSEGRNQRRNTAAALASSCNQLAWLLSKCDEHTDEAVQLSQRSLELEPERPIYLDTLGRCYFANGNLELAIETQQRAVALAPHERQMAAQLAEFQAASPETGDPAPDADTAEPSKP